MNKGKKTRTITLELDETIYALLEVLTRGQYASANSVQGVIEQLIDHAQQGVYRPGAWERDWLCSAFGQDWIEYLEPGDPWGRPEKPPKAALDYFYCADCQRTHDAERETIPQACMDINEEREQARLAGLFQKPKGFKPKPRSK